MKVGLVLEGGAMRGLYTSGVLDVFMENNIKVNTIIGVSAGALFGVNYKSNQIGRALRYNKKYANYRNYMGLYSLITTGNIMNKDFCFNELIYKLDKFEFSDFKSSPVDFYATVTNVRTGMPEYIKIDDLEDKIEYLRASGSIPLLSRIVEINGEKYLDGGISDSIPVEKIKCFDCDKIIVVLTRPSNYRKNKPNMFAYKCVYGKYPNLINTIQNRYIHYNNTLQDIERQEKENKIFVIRPTRNTGIKRIEKDVAKIEEMYNLGVSDAKQKLEELKKYLDMPCV